ncbi:AfsR/SARP family transcriptional regulator [Labedaea rhizosphaerae]|uniref:DNA-binding SARP family transcriptional activator n=1 Tax=Labedaea rhizosphaerae TaxID=598644 RepID=A0A4R6SFZ8_LABRH|nr:BTAD domain-containing putative transcriptional regulator [Labedaea rhizosphaerae]TDQ00564.1 DNA-binding SARP family transcriptional activator [Labedaea rhizosphaerae]
MRLPVVVRLLGPVRVERHGEAVDLGPSRQRAVFAVLALHANRPVPTERVLDAVWDDTPPRTGQAVVHSYVHRLRKVLGDSVGLHRTSDGYLLDPGAGALDVWAVERAASAAREAREAGNWSAAADGFADALRWWQGEPLDGLPGMFLAAQRSVLAERRWDLLEQRIECDLRSGRHRDVLAELTGLVAQRPLQENLRAHLILALYRCGRVADALSAYDDARRTLVDELGTEPSPPLRALHEQVLRADPALDPLGRARPLRTEPAHLPADLPSFTGRLAQLAVLDKLLERRAWAGPAICVVGGVGGVGKTALAVHWAQRVRDQFPDGQLYVDLRGHGELAPVDPADAAAGFLRALGVADRDVPLDGDERSVLLRSLLAARRLLMVLDNARSAQQVRPLLPGSSGCVVLVTSRAELAGLAGLNDAVLVRLDVLGDGEGRDLLARLLGADRVAAEPGAAAELVAVCDRLPLALRIAATNVAAQGLTLADAVAELRGNPLPALRLPGDDGAAVHATFAVSYDALNRVDRLVYRRAGMMPGADFDVSAIAVVTGLTPAASRASVRRLVAAHLLERRDDGRFRMHDLVRFHALSCAAAEDAEPVRDAAQRQLIGWYLAKTTAAAAVIPYGAGLLTPPGHAGLPAYQVQPFRDTAEALDWLNAECPTLLMIVRAAADGDTPAVAWLITNALRGYFSTRGTRTEQVAFGAAALAAADRTDDLVGQCVAHLMLAGGHWRAGGRDRAKNHSRTAQRLAERLDWPHAMAISLNQQGLVHTDDGELAAGLDFYRRSIEVNLLAGQAKAAASALNNLGTALKDSGELTESERCYRTLLSDDSPLGGHIARPLALGNLGDVLWLLGRYAESERCLREAIRISRADHQHLAEGALLLYLARTQASTGDKAGAASTMSAVQALRDDGVAVDDALRLNVIGMLLLIDGSPAAAAHYRAGLDAVITDGTCYDIGEALIGLARSHYARGEDTRAHDVATHAYAIARDTGMQVIAGQAQAVRAGVHLRRGELTEAQSIGDCALRWFHRAGHPAGRARALTVLARVRHRLGDMPAADAAGQEATDLYGELGGPACRRALTMLDGASCCR